MLLYVRCVNDRKGYDSAQRSVAANDTPLHDDGYRKDLLFRACVLGDRNVQTLVKNDFVPVCMTYHFETHGRGKQNADWAFAGKSGGEGFTIDPNVGAGAPGSLRLTQSGSFLQPLVRPAIGKGKYRVTARVKTQKLKGKAFVRVFWLEEAHVRKQQMGDSTFVAEEGGDWSRTSFEFELSAKPINILVMPTLFGSGTAWFDRLGRHTEARTRWTEAVGSTRWGRRSAACLLARGPHPVLSLSERTWSNPAASISTEHPESFDGKLALRILWEMQFEDGSFGDHRSEVFEGHTYSHWQAAYTGIAVQAIAAWMDKDPERKEKAEATIDRARAFLVDWSKKEPQATLGAFNSIIPTRSKRC